MSFHQFPARFGKYIVLDRVSAGGMAEVYRAKEFRENGVSPVIALKRMLPGMANDVAMEPMFVDEAKLAAQLVHPNIAQTLELGRIDDALYIAMELVWGRDLKAIGKACTKRKLQVPVGIACYIVAKAAEALDFAHNTPGADGKPLRLVHRDVSPHNLMITYDGEVKVIDFGVAKADDRSSETVHGVIKGKFSYMAPEQVTGAPVDGRTDIFGLGIVLYELLTSERLYDGSSAFSIFDKVINQPAPRVSDSVQVPSELDEVVAKCLAKKREERFENGAQLADALAPFLILERNIVGPREAAGLLRDLFPSDIADMRERMQAYDAVRESDCIDVRDEVVVRSENGTRVLVDREEGAPGNARHEHGGGKRSDSGKRRPTRAGDGRHGERQGEEWSTPREDLAATRMHVPVPLEPEVSAVEIQEQASGELEAQTSGHGLAISIAMMALVTAGAVLGYRFYGDKARNVLLPTEIVPQLVETPPPRVRAQIVTSETPPSRLAEPPVVGSLVGPVSPSTQGPSHAEPTPENTPAGVKPPENAPSETKPPAAKPSEVHPPPPRVTRTPPPHHKPAAKPTAHPTPAAGAAQAGFGAISVKAVGAGTAKVFVDGHEIGYSPVLNYKVKLGKHTVKVVPYKDELPGKASSQVVDVTRDNASTAPLRVLIDAQ